MTNLLGSIRHRAASLLRRGAERSLGRLDRWSGLSADDDERGSSTVEFVIILPIFLLIFMLSFETSMIMSRQVMLERGMDLAARGIRLDSSSTLTLNQLRGEICNRARILPECMTHMRVQLQEIDRADYLVPAISDPCINNTGAALGLEQFAGLRENKLLIMRACFAVEPVLARFGLGGDFIHPPEGGYFLSSATVVMVEPV
ncbi:MAG: TadE/TadG family type IV pilus assembly protein [Pseudomonadota bacterium]